MGVSLAKENFNKIQSSRIDLSLEIGGCSAGLKQSVRSLIDNVDIVAVELEKVKRSRRRTEGCSRDRRESSSTSKYSSSWARKEHATRRRKQRPTTRPYSSNPKRNVARNQREHTTPTVWQTDIHDRVWQTKNHESAFQLPDPWINPPLDYYERSAERWNYKQANIPTWNPEW